MTDNLNFVSNNVNGLKSKIHNNGIIILQEINSLENSQNE